MAIKVMNLFMIKSHGCIFIFISIFYFEFVGFLLLALNAN